MEEFKAQLIEEGDEDEIRADLRERFLRLLSQLSGKECSINMYENTSVNCTTKAFQPTMEKLLVENLETPLPNVIKYAVLRCNDIISIEYKL